MESTTTNTENTQQQETKWFVLRVVSGKERKVKEYLDKKISRGGWGEVVKQVFLPVVKVKKGNDLHIDQEAVKNIDLSAIIHSPEKNIERCK